MEVINWKLLLKYHFISLADEIMNFLQKKRVEKCSYNPLDGSNQMYKILTNICRNEFSNFYIKVKLEMSIIIYSKIGFIHVPRHLCCRK